MNKGNISSHFIIPASCLDLYNHFTFPLLGTLLLSNHPSLQKQVEKKNTFLVDRHTKNVIIANLDHLILKRAQSRD